MGVYIKGMEMPKSCYECRFLEGETMESSGEFRLEYHHRKILTGSTG